jgi:hypothetical protein
MKRSEFLKEVLNHTSNTVCINTEQVDVMLEIFEELGMYPPDREYQGHSVSEWEPENEKK